MEAKRSLEEAGGDIEKAVKLLNERGLASAAKRADRQTTEGTIASYIHTGGRIGSLVELNCETDFVSRTKEFQALAHDIAMQIAAMNPLYVNGESVPEGSDEVANEQLLSKQTFIKDASVTIDEMVRQLGAKTGENIRIGRFKRFALGYN